MVKVELISIQAKRQKPN